MKRLVRELKGAKQNPTTTLFGVVILAIVGVIVIRKPDLITDVDTLLALALGLGALLSRDGTADDEEEDDEPVRAVGFPIPTAEEDEE